MNKIVFILLVMLTGTQAFSQHSSIAYRKLADSLYEYHHYQYAADYYQRALKKSPEPGKLMLNIARSYVKINRSDEAEKWFMEARANHAKFSLSDYYLFSQALVAQNKRNQAETLLEHIVESDPNAHLARRALTDLRDFQKYYKDSADYIIDSLSVNSSVSEFAPLYYKNGIIFTSAREEGLFRKKSQWDNSDFLNLYFAARISKNRFEEPVVFDKQLNTQYHDGPASFYANYQKMIINRNQSMLMPGKEKIFELHPGLYDAEFDAGKSFWKVTPLPFNDPSYDYTHPSISEDGKILYFVSNQPGGFGGTDIYRVVRTNGVWGKPFNVGPAINTAENEAFPFFIDNTLYFASNGHGGVGGLDIFTSKQTLNGFTPPKNLGYPINSTSDDFSLVADSTEHIGYFASSRKGTDDLFSWLRVPKDITIMAHIYDELTEDPLSGADIQVITNGGNDLAMKADSLGDFKFVLPEDIAYAIIGTKDDKIGMVADIADRPKKHMIPASSDTTRLACIGIIQDPRGNPAIANIISVIDELTGEKLEHPGDKSMVTFLGEKGHNYNIEVQNKAGSKAQHHLVIGAHDSGTKTWVMILPDTTQTLLMAARVFRADNDQPLGYANVTVLTFSHDDQQLVADSVGMVDFELAQGTTYVIIGSKDDLTGMNSGTAEVGTDKAFMILPVPAYGDVPNSVLAMGRVTNRAGDPVDNYKAVVTNKTTGEDIPVQSAKGVLTFQGKHGDSYNISVTHDDYKPALQELILPKNGPDVEKFIVILDNLGDEKKEFPLDASAEIVDNIKTGKADLLVVDTEEGTSKMYLKSGDTFSEITERDSVLYRETPRGNVYLGKGNISDLRTRPSEVLSGLDRSDLTKLRNIYFDFDKATLEADDIEYLQHVKSVLNHDLTFTLLIAGHADDRGSDNYNIRLSRRRAQAVSKYLISEGIDKDRIIIKAYGESLPVVPCLNMDCSEEDYQKNRRAEFVLSHGFENLVIPPAPKEDPNNKL